MQIRFFELVTKKTYVPITPDRDRYGRVLPRAISRHAYETLCAVVACISKYNFRRDIRSADAREVLIYLRDNGKQRAGDIAHALKLLRPRASLLLKILAKMDLVFKCCDGQWIITPSGYALSMHGTPRDVTLKAGVLTFADADKPAIERILWTGERWKNDMASRVMVPTEELLHNILTENGMLSTNETVQKWERSDGKFREDPNAQICRILDKPFCGIRRCDAGERVLVPANSSNNQSTIRKAEGGELTHSIPLDSNRFCQLLSLPDSERFWSVPLFENLTTTKSISKTP